MRSMKEFNDEMEILQLEDQVSTAIHLMRVGGEIYRKFIDNLTCYNMFER